MASQWLQVLALFVVMAAYPHPLVWVLGTMLLGNRLLGFGVLVHECGHRTLFRTPALNDFVGRWLAAPPTFNNMRAYMRGHLEHHRLAGTTEDPDLPNYRDYPISEIGYGGSCAEIFRARPAGERFRAWAETCRITAALARRPEGPSAVPC